ncbi:MAG: hypothetical protein M1829_004066 [Trizodia sp. TS-e1964]|nr:MAG: hypothetical protein M1829_004066 [Trizodia sp. TS-e1964]
MQSTLEERLQALRYGHIPSAPFLQSIEKAKVFPIDPRAQNRWALKTPFEPHEEELQYMTLIKRTPRQGVLTARQGWQYEEKYKHNYNIRTPLPDTSKFRKFTMEAYRALNGKLPNANGALKPTEDKASSQASQNAPSSALPVSEQPKTSPTLTSSFLSQIPGTNELQSKKASIGDAMSSASMENNLSLASPQTTAETSKEVLPEQPSKLLDIAKGLPTLLSPKLQASSNVLPPLLSPKLPATVQETPLPGSTNGLPPLLSSDLSAVVPTPPAPLSPLLPVSLSALPPLLSPTVEPATIPIVPLLNLPMLSPSLPENIRQELARIRKIASQASPSTPSSSVTGLKTKVVSSPSSKPGLTEKPLPPGILSHGKSPRKGPAPVPNAGVKVNKTRNITTSGPKTPLHKVQGGRIEKERLLVKLKFKKPLAVSVKRLLTHNPPPKKNLLGSQESALATDLELKGAANGKNQTPSKATKRARPLDDSNVESTSKRQKGLQNGTSVDTPQTPHLRATPSAATTPLALGSAKKDLKHDLKNVESSELWRKESSRLLALGRKLKHTAQNLIQSSGNVDQTDGKLKLGVLTYIECLLCYFLAFTAQEESDKLKNLLTIPEIWRSFLPLLRVAINASKPFPALNGLALQLGALCHGFILDHELAKFQKSAESFSNKANKSDFQNDEKKLIEYHISLSGHFAEYRRECQYFWHGGLSKLSLREIEESFPATWAAKSQNLTEPPQKLTPGLYSGEFYLPMNATSTPMQAICFGSKLLEEWSTKNNLKWKCQLWEN